MNLARFFLCVSIAAPLAAGDEWKAGFAKTPPDAAARSLKFVALGPSARVLREGGYEAQGADGGAFSAATEEIIIEKVRDLVQRTSQ